MNANNAGMIEEGSRFCFLAKTKTMCLHLLNAGEKFDCYGSAEPEIFASIDSAHTAVTEFALDLELLSDRRTGSEVERMLPRLPEAHSTLFPLKSLMPIIFQTTVYI